MSQNTCLTLVANNANQLEGKVGELLAQMTLDEKVGQMCQVAGHEGTVPDDLRWAIREGRIGSILNEVELETINELQRIAVEESRLGIPLLVGRDVIHGFKTIFPIPLGQAASWDPEVCREGARVSAIEAAAIGVNWTFAPMIDITRDPRWGRIAESLGEDPYLCSVLGVAMVEGFQGDDLSDRGRIAACAKHFAGYGAAESGRDYNTTNIPENELRNVYLPPFKAAAEVGVATFMAAFNDLNGVPASGNELLMRKILREETGYQGFVVSDWESIGELTVHGFTANDREAAFEAANAGVDMEMVSTTYSNHLQSLVEEGAIQMSQVDSMVSNILRLKVQLGLFDSPYTDPEEFPSFGDPGFLESARHAALKSCVLLKNENNALPMVQGDLESLAVIGPMADDGYEQLGTWIFDADDRYSVTCLQGIKDLVGDQMDVQYAKGLETSRTRNYDGFGEAIEVARKADKVVMFMGEESFLSGEAHSRANIDLPGWQEQLIEDIAALGKSIVLVVLAGRPLTLENIIDKVDAVLYAWHPGAMGGPAIADLLFGIESPSGKLPVSFPRMVGQIPIYYSQKNTGRPVTEENFIHMDTVGTRPEQTSLGMSSFHLDTHYTPLFPFGFGLSYSEFKYDNIRLSSQKIREGDTLEVSVDLTNTGGVAAEEVAQLYIRDLVGNVTRPVKELKGFQKVRLEPGETRTLVFYLHTDALAFYDRKMQYIVESGQFYLWVGGSSLAELQAEFELH